MSSGYLNYQQCLPTPGRVLKKIENAEEMEEDLDSLPPPLPSDASYSQSMEHYRPGDLYDVGISQATASITFVPSRPSRNTAATPKPITQPTNTDAPSLDSPLTSTPATLHPAQRSNRHHNKPLATLSPNVSHIPQNQHAHQFPDGIILASSGTENEHPQPNLPQGNSSYSSDAEDTDPDISKKSLGDLNLNELDDLMSGLESSIHSSKTTQYSNPRNIPHRKNSSQPCPSPSSSQSTLIANSSDQDIQDRHPENNHHSAHPENNNCSTHPEDNNSSAHPENNKRSPHPEDNNRSHHLSAGTISSPGMGRRDSFRVENSLSVDGIRHSFSNDVEHELGISKSSSAQNSQPFHPEPISTPNTNYLKKDQSNASNLSSHFRVRNALQTNFKSLQSQIPFRSARRPFATRHLTEVAEDSTDLSGIPPNPSINSNRSPPPAQLVESEGEATSHDLTTYPVNRHLNGNSSFSFADRSQRFNRSKLNSYLHTLNGHLTEENHRMVHLLTETKAKLEQLTIENESLRNHAGNHHPSDDSNQSDLPERSGAMLGQIQDVLDHSIAQLQNQINDVGGDAKESPSLESYSRNVLLERQNRRLEDQIRERDNEIKELRNQLMNKYPPTQSSLCRDNIKLKDHISDLQKEVGNKDEEVVKLRLQLIETSGQHARAVSELDAKYEQAKESLSDAQEDLAAARLEAQSARNELETRMSSLKSQFAVLLAEQGKKHASLSSKLKEARRLNDAQATELKDLKANQSNSQFDPEAFVTLKLQMEQLLEGKGDQAIGRSAERRVRMLVSWLDSEISKNNKTSQDVALPATHDVEKSSQELQQLRKKIEEFRARIEELIKESSDKHNQVETLEKLLGESESARIAREHEFADLETQTDILEAKVVTQQATIKGLEAKLSHTLNSTFSDVSFTPGRLTPNRKSTHYQVELSKAQHEINRLKDLLNKSSNPAACEIQNLKIKSLETHRQELEERVGSLRRQASALMSTPSRSSIHFRSVTSLQTPKTPGQFLGNATAILGGDSGEETIVPMLNQINELHQLVEQLRHQLDLANMDVDHKLQKLTEASQNAVKISTDAINAQKRAEEYEEKFHLLEQRLDKLIADDGTIAQVKRCLSSMGCPECGEKFDANEIVRFRVVPEAQELEFIDLPAHTDTEDHSPTLKVKFKELEEKHQASQREIIKQKRELGLKSDQLEQLESEKVNYENEIEELHDQLSLARSNLERLENQVKKEEDRLKEILTKQQAVTNEKNSLEDRVEAVNLELRQTQVQLSEAIDARNSLDAEIRAIHQSKNDASGALSAQINQLQSIISKLEGEKEELSEQHASLMEEVSMLKSDLESQTQLVANREKSYHRVQGLLEKQADEATKLKDELENRSKEALELQDHKDSLVRDTKNLRKELIIVKSEAQNLTCDLQQLKEQVNRQSNLTSTNEITKIKNELSLCKKELDNYKTAKQTRRDSKMLTESSRSELEQKHNSESKGLLLRIRFLKLMFTRESLFRADLACQKRLIMVKLHRTETTNRAIHLALTDFGLPSSLHSWSTHHNHDHNGQQNCGDFTIHSTDRSFRSVAIAVRAICKLKLLSKNWNKEVLVKEKLKEAYRQVRGKEFVSD